MGYLFSDILLFIIAKKKSRCLSVSLREYRRAGSDVRQILGIGTTAAITNLAQSLCMILVNQYLLVYGSDKIAAMGIVLKVNMIAQLILMGFAFGGVPLFGYLYGADDRKRLKRLIGFCLTFLGGLAFIMSAVLFVAAPLLMQTFMDVDSIVTEGTLILRWQVAGNLFAAVVLLMTCLFQATGKMLAALLLSVSRQGVLFIIVLVVAVHIAQYYGVLASQFVADFLSALAAIGLYIAVFIRRANQAAIE